ncbi:MAG TPA: MBL fold metallo-hydrolase [Chthonomonadaceae bacterium]|nr:MBL fold metallo-hydrolase [Chthonomonadaceae bacterium]
MEILFCGTAAAEGWPALFCTCPACQQARANGGNDVRSRAAYMLGDRIRLDFGPDSNLHQQKYGLAFEKLEHLLVTHSHSDHWFPTDLYYRRAGFSITPDNPLHVWGNAKVEAKFVEANGSDWGRYKLEFHRLKAWEPVELGEGVSATPVLAAHDRSEECFNFRVEAEGRAALFGHDTGWYDAPTWEFLSGKPIHLLILDGTYGTEDNQQGHMGGLAVVRARDELARRGALAPDARCIVTHFSHNSRALYADLERFFAPHGIQVAYDGLRVAL